MGRLQLTLGSRVAALKTGGIGKLKQKAACRTTPTPGGKHWEDWPSHTQKFKMVEGDITDVRMIWGRLEWDQ